MDVQIRAARESGNPSILMNDASTASTYVANIRFSSGIAARIVELSTLRSFYHDIGQSVWKRRLPSRFRSGKTHPKKIQREMVCVHFTSRMAIMRMDCG
jgi:hypothetical protein